MTIACTLSPGILALTTRAVLMMNGAQPLLILTAKWQIGLIVISKMVRLLMPGERTLMNGNGSTTSNRAITATGFAKPKNAMTSTPSPSSSPITAGSMKLPSSASIPATPS